MRQLQPVVWAKGTFLTPNHLQSQELYWESILGFRVDSLSFRPWGLLSMEVDLEALRGGTFSLHSASGLFGDGLAFDIPAADPAPPAKALGVHLGRDEQLDLFLAVPPYRFGGLNIAGKTQNADTRFVVDELDIRDENNGRTERKIQVARKNFQILTEPEVRRGTPALRIARIRRGPGGVPELDQNFVPPVLDIAASGRLLSIASGVLARLTARSTELSSVRRQRSQGLADFTSSDIANFWLLYTMNTHLPVFRHIFETRRGHPELLFSTLLSLAGALTAFSNEIAPGDLPLYDHESLAECFTELEVKLQRLLDAVVPRNFVSLPLVKSAPYIYGCALDDDKLLNGKMYLAVSAALPEAELIGRVPQLLTLCSGTQIDQWVRRALPGLAMRYVATPPAAVPMKLKYRYFSLNQAGDAWTNIQRARNFAAYVPAEVPEPQLELVILLPEND